MISAKYIVKNEQDNIVRSLNSVRDLVNEIIIVDTGSTDNTIDVINKWHNALGIINKPVLKLFTHEWNGFADARNFAISKCTQDWILTIDADETVENHNGLKQLISDTDIDIWECVQLDLDGQMCSTLRLFRNGIKYRQSTTEDEIHEVLDFIGWKLGKSDLVIKHWKQLTPEQHKAKIERIMGVFAEVPEGVKKDYYEGVYYLHTGQSQKGIDCLNSCVDKVTPALRSFIYMMVGSFYGKLANIYTDLEAGYLQKCIDSAPEQNEGYIRLSDYYLTKGNIYKAIECLVTLQGRKNKLITDLQNDKFYSNEEIEQRINQLKEINNGINSN